MVYRILLFPYRTQKGNITFDYDNDGRLVRQSDGLEFIYDANGVAALTYLKPSQVHYFFYRKDAQGNIIAILDNTGKVVVKYVYDAWGNHAVLCLNKVNGIEVLQDLNDDTAPAFDSEYVFYRWLGTCNPFRYRGYYYDTETELYYLHTRYYDPEVGRFISADSIEYADPETINGFNLYAYCANNPIMAIDPEGTKLK